MSRRRSLCPICRKRKVTSKGTFCPPCGRVAREVLRHETHEMVKDIATATKSVIESLEEGVVHYDLETDEVLTDPAEIVTGIMEDRIFAHAPLSEMMKEHPHLMYKT